MIENKLFMNEKMQKLLMPFMKMELLLTISVNAVNDLESRMQNEIAVIELDQPQQNWICRLWIGSAGFDLKTADIGVKIL